MDIIKPEDVTEKDLANPDYLAMRKELAEEVEEGINSDAVESAESTEVVDQEERHSEKTPDAEPVKTEDDAIPAWAQTFMEKVEASVMTLSTIPERLKQTESRLGAIQNQFYAAKEAADKVANSPTKEQMAKAAESSEDWDRLKGDFPEWADAIDGRIAAMSGGANAEEVAALKEEIKTIKAEAKPGMSQGQVNRMIAVAVLEFAHPGHKKTIKSKEYADWLKGQKPEVIAKTSSLDFNDAIEVLDLYKGVERSDNGEKTATEIAEARTRRLASATTPRGSKAKAPKSEGDMSEQEFRKKAAAEVWDS